MRLEHAAAAVTALALAACSTNPSTNAAGCRDAPSTCAAGTTCWPTDEHGSFACLPSKTYAPKGTDCEILAGHTGCADGLVCVTSDSRPDANAPVSYCAPFCDPNEAGGCAEGEVCAHVSLFEDPASAVWACVQLLPGGVSDGGTD